MRDLWCCSSSRKMVLVGGGHSSVVASTRPFWHQEIESMDHSIAAGRRKEAASLDCQTGKRDVGRGFAAKYQSLETTTLTSSKRRAEACDQNHPTRPVSSHFGSKLATRRHCRDDKSCARGTRRTRCTRWGTRRSGVFRRVLRHCWIAPVPPCGGGSWPFAAPWVCCSRLT